MDTAIVYWAYVYIYICGRMEKKMETPIVYCRYIYICKDNRKENGNYYDRLEALGFRIGMKEWKRKRKLL